MPGEDDYYQDAENIILDLTADVDITINVSQTLAQAGDTETATKKYLGKGTLGTGFILRPSVPVSIVQLGSKVYRNPITVSAAGYEWTKKIKQFDIIVLRPAADGTAELQIL